MARIVDSNTVGVEPKKIFTAPGIGVGQLLESNGLTVDDVDLFEINEAFAVQVLQNIAHLGIDQSKLNIGGGGIAIGHPIGASGARVLVSLLHHMIETTATSSARSFSMFSSCSKQTMPLLQFSSRITSY